MASAWGYSFGKAFGNAFGSISEQGGGRRRHHGTYFVPWHEVKKRANYKKDRVPEKYTVLVDGKAYDPLVANMKEVLLDSVSRPLQGATELERQDSKLARRFAISDGRRAIEVPLFKPLMPQLPDFESASIDDFESFAEHAEKEINEERRRIVLLLH